MFALTYKRILNSFKNALTGYTAEVKGCIYGHGEIAAIFLLGAALLPVKTPSETCGPTAAPFETTAAGEFGFGRLAV
jgi:hypothetical protein